MSVRKRSWKTASGETKEKWVADYVDQIGKRHIKTCDRKKDADAFLTTAKHEISEGSHTAASQSKTIAEAAEKWLQSGEARGLEASTLAAYRQHVKLHILPYLGR